MDLDEKELQLKAKLERIEAYEAQLKEKEKELKAKESARKQVLLRLAPGLWEELAAWAEQDFRSINGQIEFLLTECVRKRKE